MNKAIVLLTVVLFSFGFSASTNFVPMSVAGKGTATIPLALGAAVVQTLTTADAASITINVSATTGRGELPQVMTLKNRGVAITTVDVIVITSMQTGDIVGLQSERASEDMVIVEGTGLNLGAATRTLSDPADRLWLYKRNATNLDEFLFNDNN